MLNNRVGPQAREPSKCLNGQSYGERLAKKAFWSPATRGSNQDSDRVITPAVKAVCVPANLAPPRSPQAKQLSHLQLNSHWDRAATGKTSLVSIRAGSLQSYLSLCDPVDCGLPGFSVRDGGFSRQEYWSISANIDCHTFLEHYISCFPSHQLPWVPDAARTPATQAAAPSPHLALTGANPSPPRQSQEQTPVDDLHAEVEIKPQLKPRGSVAKEEDPKSSNQLYKLQIKYIQSTRQMLCLWNI